MKMMIMILCLGLGHFALAETTIQVNLPGISYGSGPQPTVIWVGNHERNPASVSTTTTVPVPVPAAQENKPIPYNPQDYWQQPGSAREFYGR